MFERIHQLYTELELMDLKIIEAVDRGQWFRVAPMMDRRGRSISALGECLSVSGDDKMAAQDFSRIEDLQSRAAARGKRIFEMLEGLKEKTRDEFVRFKSSKTNPNPYAQRSSKKSGITA